MTKRQKPVCVSSNAIHDTQGPLWLSDDTQAADHAPGPGVILIHLSDREAAWVLRVLAEQKLH